MKEDYTISLKNLKEAISSRTDNELRFGRNRLIYRNLLSGKSIKEKLPLCEKHSIRKTLLNLKKKEKAVVLKCVMTTSQGKRWCYIQKITSKSIVVINDENTLTVYDRVTGKQRKFSKLSSHLYLDEIDVNSLEEFMTINGFDIWDGGWRSYSKFYNTEPDESLFLYNFIHVSNDLEQPDKSFIKGYDFDSWFKSQDVSIIKI